MYYWAGLTLLGLGWNFLFVGATSLLTTTYEPWEKAKVQSANDFLIFGTMALVTGLAAPLEAHFGWRALNQGTIPVLLLVGLSIAWLQVRQRSTHLSRQRMVCWLNDLARGGPAEHAGRAVLQEAPVDRGQTLLAPEER